MYTMCFFPIERGGTAQDAPQGSQRRDTKIVVTKEKKMKLQKLNREYNVYNHIHNVWRALMFNYT